MQVYVALSCDAIARSGVVAETPAGGEIQEKSLLLVVYGRVCVCVRVFINHSLIVSVDK